MPDDLEKSSKKRDVTVHWVRQIVSMKRNPIWQPATDAYETPNHFTVIVELAGMQLADFPVQLAEQRLTISGKRIRPTEPEPTAYHQLEIQYGEFRVEVDLPWAVDQEHIAATYEDGFLRVELPRRQAHTISISQQDHNE